LTSSGNQTYSYAFSLFPSYDRDHQLVECLVLKKVSVLVVKFSGETKINKSNHKEHKKDKKHKDRKADVSL
jgi:hypothetical protein